MTETFSIPVHLLPGEGILEQTLKQLALPEEPDQLTLAEVERASRDPKWQSYFRLMTPSHFFQASYCYVVARWFHDRQKNETPAADPPFYFVHGALAGSCNLKEQNDLGLLVKGVILARDPEGLRLRPSEVLPLSVFQDGVGELVTRGKALIPNLSTPEIVDLLRYHRQFPKKEKEGIVSTCANEMQKRGERSTEAGEILVELLRQEQEDWLEHTVKMADQEMEKIERAAGFISFLRSFWKALKKSGAEQTPPDNLSESNPPLTRAGHLAFSLGLVGVATPKVVKGLLDVIGNNRYSDGTRMRSVSALTEIVLTSKDQALKKRAAEGLTQFLQGRHLGRKREGIEEHLEATVREALNSLRRLEIEPRLATIEMLKLYVFNTTQPIPSVLAISVLGEMLPRAAPAQEKIIRKALVDVLDMPGNPLAQKAAAVWLSK